METDIFAVETDIFRYSEPMPWSHRQNLAPEAAPAQPPKPPELPPAIEAAASATQGNQEAVNALMPKAPKKPKPLKPVPVPPPVLSKQNPLGFHESAIKRALETFQNPSGKGTREQLLKHLEGHQGTKQEAELTGLHDFLKDKPNVSRDDVLKHLQQTPHKIRMEEHDQENRPPKWSVVSDLGYGDNTEYDSEEEAQAAADEANDEHHRSFRDEFEIEGEIPHYTVDTSALEALEEKEKELGGEMTMEASRALQRLGRSQFDSTKEAQEAIDSYVRDHLPNIQDTGFGKTVDDPIEENEGSYRVSRSPLSSRQHARHFDTNYDSEEEAQDAIDNYVSEHHKPPYSVEQADPEWQESYEEYSLKGPKDNYNETHVAIPGLRAKPDIDPSQFKAELVEAGKNGRNLFSIQDKNGVHKDTFWLLGEDPERAVNAWAKEKNEERTAKSWCDGHGNYEHIENPVVRIRHDDRETTDGKKMFFVEELQGPQDNQQEKMPSWLQDRIYDVGLKRALVKAVQGGYDRLGWTTGNQQADRYNLRKAVDRIEWTPKGELAASGGRNIAYGDIVGIKDGKPVVSKTIDGDELEEYIGKEVAAKLLASQEQKAPIKQGMVTQFTPGEYRIMMRDGSHLPDVFKSYDDAEKYLLENQDKWIIPGPVIHAIEGPDLELGGRGLKQTYDVDLHRRLLDIKIGDKKLKNLGVKIGKSDIPNGQWNVLDDRDNVRTYPDEATARHNAGIGANIEPETDTVHSIDIPPELAAEIKRHGVSLYSKQPSSPGSDGRLQFSRDRLLDIVRRMPASEAVVYAAGVLKLLDLRPMLLKSYTTEEIAYLRGLIHAF